MYAAAPLIDARLRRSASRRARTEVSIAEIWRQVNADAARLSLPRPSYEGVRVYVRRARDLLAAGRTVVVVVPVQRRGATQPRLQVTGYARRIFHHLRR